MPWGAYLNASPDGEASPVLTRHNAVPRTGTPAVPDDDSDSGLSSSSSSTSSDSESDERELAEVIAAAMRAFTARPTRAASSSRRSGATPAGRARPPNLSSVTPRRRAVDRETEISESQPGPDSPSVHDPAEADDVPAASSQASQSDTPADAPHHVDGDEDVPESEEHVDPMTGRGGFLTHDEIERRHELRRRRAEAAVRVQRPFHPKIYRHRVRSDIVKSARESRSRDNESASSSRAQPTAVETTQRGRHANRGDKSTFDRLYADGLQERQARQTEAAAKRISYERRRELFEEMECTFKPVTTTPPDYVAVRSRSQAEACSRLYRLGRYEQCKDVQEQMERIAAAKREAEAAKAASPKMNAAQERLAREAERRLAGRARPQPPLIHGWK